MSNNVLHFPLTPNKTLITSASRLTTANVRAAIAAKKKAGRMLDVGDLAYCPLNNKVARVWEVQLDENFEVARYLVVYDGGIKSWKRPNELRPVTDMTGKSA